MTRLADNTIDFDGAIIVGAGIAGLFTALKLAPFPALILSATRPGAAGSSAWAQGGIAAAVGAGDSWMWHAEDTLSASAGIGDREVAEFTAREAPDRIDDLIRWGAPFDRQADGTLALAREAAHRVARVVHVSGDRAGAEITRTLVRAVSSVPSISILEGVHAIELAMQDGRITGLFARSGAGRDAKLMLLRARAVILATGGIGALYAVTTNPLESRGEGLGMAARAGVLIADPEFVQFHPTAIAIGRDPAPLATEALRGEGAVLIDDRGHRFMPAVHPSAELAPRDVVARAIHREIARGRRVFLDCRSAIGAGFAARFPTVHTACVSSGIDPVTDPIPVAPAAHYHMGGVATGHSGRSSLSGLWCVGESASTGLHGANRLASNSLLEALVFGARVAADVKGERPRPNAPRLRNAPEIAFVTPPPQILREAMSRDVGLERDEKGLRRMLAAITGIERTASHEPTLFNIIAAAKLVAAGALVRRESLGAHFRSDHPRAGESPKRSFLTLADAERIARDSEISEHLLPLARPQ